MKKKVKHFFIFTMFSLFSCNFYSISMVKGALKQQNKTIQKQMPTLIGFLYK